MANGTERGAGSIGNRVVEAAGAGMGEHNHDLHDRPTILPLMDATRATEAVSRAHRVRSPVAAYLLGFVLIGVAANTAGPALSHLRERAHTDDAGIAVVFACLAAGGVIGSLLAGRGLDAGHGHRRWSIAMATATASMVLIGLAHSLTVMGVGFVVMGIAERVGDVSGNALVVWSRPGGAGPLLNALHLGYAVGALIAPIVVDRSLHLVHSVVGVAVPMALLTATASALMLSSPPPARTRLDTVARSRASGARSIHVAAVGAYFFVYVALEMGFASWIHTYAEQIGYARAATGVTTMFGAGLVAGRALAIPASRRWSPGWIVAATSCLTIVVTLLFFAFRGPGTMLWVVTALFALSVAPQYASMMAFAEQHLALSGRNASAVVGASALGALTLPWLMGLLFDRIGPQALPPVTVVLAVLAALAALAVGRLLVTAR